MMKRRQLYLSYLSNAEDLDNYMFVGVIKPSGNLIIYNAVSFIDC